MTLEYINRKITKNYWSSSLGFARASFAICTLLTLLFNESSDLFRLNGSGNLLDPNWYNIFSIFGDLYIGKILAICILVSVILGYFPRFTALLHFWVSYSFLMSAFMIEGGDHICTLMTLYITPILLFDSRLNHYKQSTDFENKSYYIKLLGYVSFTIVLIQVSMIYFFAACGKFANPEWIEGTAVYYWINDPTFGVSLSLGSFLNEIFKNPYVVLFFTWGTLIGEIFLFSRLFSSSKRYIRNIFYFGVFFHFSIIVFFGLVSFFFAMLGALILYTLWLDDFFSIFKSIKFKKSFNGFQFKIR